MSAPTQSAPQLSIAQVLLCGGAIVTLSMGIRHGFGMWLQPITLERGWPRETFAFAVALQNLAWGIAGPFVGALADRFGTFKVLLGSALMYAAGLTLMAFATSGLAFASSAGILIGLALAGCTYAVIYGVIGRNVPAERRSWAMGVTAAAGSFGQFLVVPVASGLIGAFGWQNALLMLGLAVLMVMPLAFGLREPARDTVVHGTHQSVFEAAREAFGYRSFQWLMTGYFVCGFQTVFIAVHLPSYLRDHNLTPQVATTALALIGLFNVIGTYAAGSLGQRFPKRRILSTIYILRSVTIVAFLAAPLTPWSVYAFAAIMGLLWLSTVPTTNAVIAQMFGLRHFSMLGGFVFLGHQIGSFLGAWLGGRLYDATGSYDVVWWIAAALGVLAAVVNVAVRETAIQRPTVAAAAA
ncbi:MAG: MFS transporter [Burkholderiaceae bacterium]|nr:MFS transporter [Burkholderiaceae bacterium]